MINSEKYKYIINNADIVKTISDFVQLKKKSNNFWGKCPFHDDHNDSFSVNLEKKIWKCWSENIGGNVIDFIMKKTGKSEFEAIKYIAEKNNIDIKNIFNKNEYDTINANAALYKVNEKANFVYTSLLYNPENVQYLEYLYKRKFSDELIKKFGIGYSGEGNLVPELLMSDNFKITKKQLIEVGIMNIKDNGYESVLLRNRVTFPIKDENGNIVAFSGRIIVSNEKDVKYLHSLETKIFSKSKILFNLHNVLALKEDKKLIICEGYMDVIGFYRAGVENVVATMGTALTENHISLIKKYKTLILSFDKDDAGINAVISNARKLIKLQFDVWVIGDFRGCKDVDELELKYGKESVLEALDTKTDYITFFIKNCFKNIKTKEDIFNAVNECIEEIKNYANFVYKDENIALLARLSKIDVNSIRARIGLEAITNTTVAVDVPTAAPQSTIKNEDSKKPTQVIKKQNEENKKPLSELEILLKPIENHLMKIIVLAINYPQYIEELQQISYDIIIKYLPIEVGLIKKLLLSHWEETVPIYDEKEKELIEKNKALKDLLNHKNAKKNLMNNIEGLLHCKKMLEIKLRIMNIADDPQEYIKIYDNVTNYNLETKKIKTQKLNTK